MKPASDKPEYNLLATAYRRESHITPSEDEWRFDRVQAEEVAVCFLYEYGRRSEKFRERVEAWRKRHPKIIPAARKLLARDAAFAITVGALPQERKTKFMSLYQNKSPSKAEINKAAENGNAWHEWGLLTMGLVGSSSDTAQAAKMDLLWPDRMRGNDPRLFLYYFPPFPAVPWLKIRPERTRRVAFTLLTPQPLNAENLVLLILTAGRDFSGATERQRQYQVVAGSPMEARELENAVRQDIGRHMFALPLREGRIGPALPMSAEFDLGAGWLRMAEVVHQEVSFVVNWAQSDKAIVKAFNGWLKAKGHRPHPALKVQNLTTAREHLNKLSALRLLARLSHKDAVEVASKTGLYSDEKALRRAASQAEHILTRLFPD
jgi:hypothetical protein